MALTLTPEMLAHVYDYLSCQRPYSGWNLPPSEDIKFKVSRRKDRFAHYQMIGGEHHIVFSPHYVGRHDVVIATMAHEMLHVYTEVHGIDDSGQHGPVFQKLADKVCRIHEFDRRTF
jgi:hypothetical protein